MSPDIVSRVRNSIRERALIENDEAVLLGVSGGVDSMVLLHILHQLAPGFRWRLIVAHFNHQLRGAESDADETFVQREAERLGLSFQRGSGDVRGMAAKEGVSTEMAARALRHAFFAETARSLGIKTIALAHHRNDQVETFWLRLLRGDVGPGLAGMRWKRPSSAGADLSVVRPLLDIPKADLVSFAHSNRISSREDATNQEALFQRNQLRLEVLPRLTQFQPSLEDITIRTAEVLGDEKAFLQLEAERWLDRMNPPFGELHVGLQREVIRLQLLALNSAPNFDLIESLRRESGRPISVAPNMLLTRRGDGRVLKVPSAGNEFRLDQARVKISPTGSFNFAGHEFRWSIASEHGRPEPGMEYFDAQSIGPEITLRFWQPGDRFQPIGAAQNSKLQDLFTNLKIPSSEKRNRIVALAGDQSIFWVEGLRISERHKVLPNSLSILKWSWRKMPS